MSEKLSVESMYFSRFLPFRKAIDTICSLTRKLFSLHAYADSDYEEIKLTVSQDTANS